MIDETIHFQNSIAENLTVALNTIFEFFHTCLPRIFSLDICALFYHSQTFMIELTDK